MNYIDLALPSGTLWANINSKVEGQKYFTYDESVKYFKDSLPSKEQWLELIDNCDCSWNEDKRGYNITGKNGNSIFLPAAGSRYGTSVFNIGSRGLYWSSSYFNSYYAWCVYFRSGRLSTGLYFTRNDGFSVRTIKYKNNKDMEQIYKKKYEEALERAKEVYNRKDATNGGKLILESMFPELKESEDERIRKEILNVIYQIDDNTTICGRKYDYPKWIAWLEKQSEKTIPEDIDDAALQYVDTCALDGEITHDNITEPYWNNHSMMNAYKAGWLKKQGEQKKEIKYIYPKFRVGDVIEPVKPNGHYAPVRVKYIGEGNYSCESDDGKSFLSFPICNENEYVLTKQKNDWSEEDEKMINSIVENLDNGEWVDIYQMDWLKSLTEKMKGE